MFSASTLLKAQMSLRKRSMIKILVLRIHCRIAGEPSKSQGTLDLPNEPKIR